MSLPCETCPIVKGLPAPGDDLEICGRPIAQCHEYRDTLARQLKDWQRLGQIAELGSSRMVHLSLLSPGDYCVLYASAQYGSPYLLSKNDKDSLWLAFTVVEHDANGGLLVRVEEDEYYAPHDDSGLQWPIPEGEKITIIGACNDREPSAETQDGYNDGEHTIGSLLVGQLVVMERAGKKFCNLMLQEVQLETLGGTSATLFDTYPYVFRPPFSNSTQQGM